MWQHSLFFTNFLIWRSIRLCSRSSSFHNVHHSSARNLGFIFDEHLSFSDQISALSKSCYSLIRALRCIRPYLDHEKTASTIATSIVHSKFDYCNSFYHNLPNSQLHRLQLIQNCCPHCFQYSKNLSHHSSPIASLHFLKIKERIEYKLLSLTYKILTTSQATYLHNLVSPQSPRGTRSSSIATLSRLESRNARNLVS